MTKEELYEKMHKALRPVTRDTELATDLLDEFFESNVCIPKGANRHPYADILHQWIEGATLQYKLDSGWVDYRELSMPNQEHRIKPSEPIWEYQWLEDGKVQNLGFYTEELEDCPNKVYERIQT